MKTPNAIVKQSNAAEAHTEFLKAAKEICGYTATYRNDLKSKGLRRVKFYNCSTTPSSVARIKALAKDIYGAEFHSVVLNKAAAHIMFGAAPSITCYFKLDSKTTPKVVKQNKKPTKKDLYEARGSFSRKAVDALKVGTWLQIKELNAMDRAVLIVEVPPRKSVKWLYVCDVNAEHCFNTYFSIDKSQVVGVLGVVKVPKIIKV